ncbi:zinc finger, MIZ-type, Zinc finger, RING/FYVE/PHD-type, E3 SUMO protein ligase [Artemisia annua]|uniref:Zinc finger, MIZ-type, Zinc finger, RING/FYVE/PHD-type, E3 SUMO protein ligase n=1 Tax=Artemisia annua TaxID=35608 RepID=A0A2U1Q0U3_ARTAN|nr:zinc finger, MIZ-type, Zinc finger, RING/FYVE/PHD-type, E3 SUMO protein ligase [Artemisia annua]
MTDIQPQGSTKMLVEMNIDQVSAYIQNGDIKDSAVYSKACVELGSAIDSAIGMDEVPSSSDLLKLLSVMKEVYIRKTDSLEPSLMLLMLPIKAACKVGWFPDGDIKNDLLLMAKEVSIGFSHTNKMIIEPSYAHSRISDIISRFYPRMNVEHILTSFDVKAGYGTFIADFHISQSMAPPPFENLWLLVARTDNMDTAACIASPSNVEFLLNGSRVPKRTKNDMPLRHLQLYDTVRSTFPVKPGYIRPRPGQIRLDPAIPGQIRSRPGHIRSRPDPVISGLDPVISGQDPVISSQDPAIPGHDPVISGQDPAIPVMTRSFPVKTRLDLAKTHIRLQMIPHINKVILVLCFFLFSCSARIYAEDKKSSWSKLPPHHHRYSISFCYVDVIMWLLVARTDNMDTAACIASPSNVEFLLNGSRVPKRTKNDMPLRHLQLYDTVRSTFPVKPGYIRPRPGQIRSRPGHIRLDPAIPGQIRSTPVKTRSDPAIPGHIRPRPGYTGHDPVISGQDPVRPGQDPYSASNDSTYQQGIACIWSGFLLLQTYTSLNLVIIFFCNTAGVSMRMCCSVCCSFLSYYKYLSVAFFLMMHKIKALPCVFACVLKGKGPQLPSNMAKMIKYGVNLLEVLGDFEAIMNWISSPNPPQLQDYVQPLSENVDLDDDIIRVKSWISLNCPISQFRIKTPVKGYLCKHPQILNEVTENISDVIISTDGSWMTSVTEKSEINETNRDTTSQNNHVTDDTENHMTIEANDTIDNSSSALRNLGGSPVSASAEPPSTLWQSTVTTPAVFTPPVLGDPRLPPLVTCDPVVPPSSTHHMNSVNLTTRSTTQVSYSLTNPNHPSPEAQPQQGQADRAAQADFGTSTTEQSQGATFSTPSATNSQHSIALAFNQLRKRHEQQHYNAPVQSQVNVGKTAQAQSTTFVKQVQVPPSATNSPPSKQPKRRVEQQHYTTDPGQPQVNVGTTAKAQCKTMFTTSATSSPHPIALSYKYYSRRGQRKHYTDSEQSQVSVDRTTQAQNTTMFNPDATTSPSNIGLAVALAFEHLKRGDGQQHYIPPGQAQPEVRTTKLTIARPFKFRRVDELHYSTGRSPANSGANKQAQDTTMFTPVRLPPSGQVDVQLRKRARAPTGPTTKTPSLDSHLITARTSMLGQDVQQHHTTPRPSKVNIGKTKQVQRTTMLPPAVIRSLQSVARGYEQ